MENKLIENKLIQAIEIKQKIVDGYRRGVCDHNGDTLPREKRGRNGKGSHFTGGGLVGGIGESKLNIWPRDENGNLIDG